VIVLDSSAIVAILTNEPERANFEKAVSSTSQRLISAVNYQETAQVIFGRFGGKGLANLDTYIELIEAEVVPYTFEMAAAAVGAFKRYGKGLNPKTRLNMGDCAAYALATYLDAPLLYKGDDFTHTDVKSWR
jgi:ribonuclease VapC